MLIITHRGQRVKIPHSGRRVRSGAEGVATGAKDKGHVSTILEDEEGHINLIVRPQVYEHYKAVLRHTPLLWAEGKLQREGHAISVLVHKAGALTPDANGDARVVPARRHGRGRRQTV